MGDNDMCCCVCVSCMCVLIGDMDVSKVMFAAVSLTVGESSDIGGGASAMARCSGVRGVLACGGVRSGVRSGVCLRLRQSRLSRRSCLSLCARQQCGVIVVGSAVVCSSLEVVVGVLGGVGVGGTAGIAHNSSVGVVAAGMCGAVVGCTAAAAIVVGSLLLSLLSFLSFLAKCS